MTQARFRRQVWLEIYLPFAGGLVAVAIFAYAVTSKGVGTASAWADAVLSLMLIPALLAGLILLVVTAAAAFGIGWLVWRIPPPARRVHQLASRIESSSRQAMDLAAEPVLRLRAAVAAAEAVRDSLRSVLRTSGG